MCAGAGLHDICVEVKAFIPSNSKDAIHLKHNLFRWIRAYHRLALGRFTGFATSDDLERIVGDFMTPDEYDSLKFARQKPQVVLSWLSRALVEHREIVDVGDALLTRIFQLTTQTNEFFNQTRSIAETPFPFPYSQLAVVATLVWAILLPIFASARLPTLWWLSGLCSFMSSWLLFATNEAAANLETPFDLDQNDLPVNYLAYLFDADVNQIQYGREPEFFTSKSFACPKDYENSLGVLPEGHESLSKDSSKVHMPHSYLAHADGARVVEPLDVFPTKKRSLETFFNRTPSHKYDFTRADYANPAAIRHRSSFAWFS